MKYIFFFLLFTNARAYSQQKKTNISGTVTDKNTTTGLEFVNVILLKQKDSTNVAGTVSDRKGKFVFDGVLPGNYFLQYSFIGYKKFTSSLLTITGEQKNVVIPAATIGNNSDVLKDVIVVAKKSMLLTSIDRKVYNVEQDIFSKSGSVSDILKNIPSVEVDIDGNVALRGSGNVMILINGKPSPMMGKSKAEVLQSLPANAIERIEVITNPSAKYRPDGTSGIINIVLKKNIKTGWNGTATLNAGNKDRYNGNLALNYNTGKINIYGSYSLRQDNRTRKNNIDRIYFDSIGKPESYYTEVNISTLKPVANVVNIGTDIKLNEKNSFGISGNYFYRKLVKNDVVNKLTNNYQNILIEKYDRFRIDPEFEKQTNAVAFYEHKFKKEDNNIRIEFNKAKKDEVENNRYKNLYYYPLKNATFDNTIICQKENTNQLTIDYSYPINENTSLETGFDGSYNKHSFNFYGEYFDTIQNKFLKDIVKSNQFLYKELLNAIYFTYKQRIKAFGYQVGIRAEQVNINGNLVTLDSSIKNIYFKIYPTLHLSYKLNSTKELQLNYSKRINRPDADALNPFPEYRDPRNLQSGNPALKPEIINSVEFGYKWQNKQFSFVPSLYYRHKTNGFTQIIKALNDSTLLTTSTNLANEQSAGLELIFSAKAGKFFSANMSNNIFYNQIDASNIGYSQKKSIVTFSTNINATFTVKENTMLQLSSNYRSARLTPQGKVYSSIIVNSGIRQDFLKKKLSATFTATDIFATLKEKRDLNTIYLQQTSIGRRDARIFYIGASYRFGKIKKATKEDKIQFDNGG